MSDDSGFERRKGKRFPADLEVDWESSAGRGTGSLSDISETGCFILCGGGVTEGESVRVLFPLGDGMSAEFRGEVVNFTEEVGFGLRFDALTPAQRDLVSKVIRDNSE